MVSMFGLKGPNSSKPFGFGIHPKFKLPRWLLHYMLHIQKQHFLMFCLGISTPLLINEDSATSLQELMYVSISHWI